MANRLAEKVTGPVRLEDSWADEGLTLEEQQARFEAGFCRCGTNRWYLDCGAVMCDNCHRHESDSIPQSPTT